MIRKLVLVWLFLAAPLALSADKSRIYFYNVVINHADPVNGELLPDHMYLRYESDWSRWVMILTDAQGHIPSPTEAFMPGSILKGSRLGDTDERRYLLTNDGRWVPTQKPAVSFFWVNADPPYLKTARVETPAS